MCRRWSPGVRAALDAVCPLVVWRSWPGIWREGPAAHGWVKDQVWTAARVAMLIGRKFHVFYSVSGVTRLMHRLGFSRRFTRGGLPNAPQPVRVTRGGAGRRHQCPVPPRAGWLMLRAEIGL
ncbi:winged helix-turn-helix domain-containing protein [Streptomyces sp. LN245]|uniref:helix-turn-helix domain-containing protein n=1 Tax=Streptomyces sp. LN245 TaxID=3112975 RepID=UPI00371AEB33